LGKREKLRQFHRNEILQATYRLCEKGFISKVTMREISKESEYTLVTIYKYFGNKEELFFELITILMEEKSKWIYPIMDQSDNILEKMFAYVQGNFEYLKKFPLELEVVSYILSPEFNRQNPSGQIQQQLAERTYKLLDFIKEILKKGINENVFLADLDILMTCDLLIVTFTQILYMVFCLKTRPESYFWEYAKIFLRSIVTESGQADLRRLLSQRLELPPLPDKVVFKISEEQ